jgi:hypothetical protein
VDAGRLRAHKRTKSVAGLPCDALVVEVLVVMEAGVVVSRLVSSYGGGRCTCCVVLLVGYVVNKKSVEYIKRNTKARDVYVSRALCRRSYSIHVVYSSL